MDPNPDLSAIDQESDDTAAGPIFSGENADPGRGPSRDALDDLPSLRLAWIFRRDRRGIVEERRAAVTLSPEDIRTARPEAMGVDICY